MLIMASILHLGKSGLPKKVCGLVCMILIVFTRGHVRTTSIYFLLTSELNQMMDQKPFKIKKCCVFFSL